MLRCNWDPREQAFCLRFALLSSHISPHVLTGSSNVRIDFLVHANKVSSSERSYWSQKNRDRDFAKSSTKMKTAKRISVFVKERKILYFFLFLYVSFFNESLSEDESARPISSAPNREKSSLDLALRRIIF